MGEIFGEDGVGRQGGQFGEEVAEVGLGFEVNRFGGGGKAVDNHETQRVQDSLLALGGWFWTLGQPTKSGKLNQRVLTLCFSFVFPNGGHASFLDVKA